VRYVTLFSSALLLSLLGLGPSPRAGDISAEGPSLDAELAAKYPRSPKTLEGDPMQSSLLLLEFEFKGIIRLNGLDGAALVMSGDGGGVIRASTMKGRLVMFNLGEPGTYSLRFIRLSNYNATIILEKPPALEMNVAVARGKVTYLGTIVVTKKFGPKLPEMDLIYDAEKEMAAWSTLREKYKASPWSALAEKRIASLKSGEASLAEQPASSASATAGIRHSPDTGEGHAHLSLVDYPPAILSAADAQKMASEARQPTFLASSAKATENPLAPCSLLAAALIALDSNLFWWDIEKSGSVSTPPPNTNILGMFDRDLENGKVPRKEPRATAEILARLTIWRSWGINAEVNTFLSDMTQRACLDTLLAMDPNAVFGTLNGYGARTTASHLAAISRYSVTLSREQTEKDLAEMRDDRFLTRSSRSTENPLLPCALLKAKRLGSRLNDLVGEILSRKVERPMQEDGMLGRFSEDLRDGSVHMDDPAKAAEIAALLFAARIGPANAATDILISESTQRECLDEIFSPGLIRQRLEKEGKLPSRAELLKKAFVRVYDEAADAQQQIAAALVKAKQDNRRVLIQWGGNWCPWCIKLHDLYEKDSKISLKLQDEYEVVYVDAGGKTKKNMDLAKSYGADLAVYGVPFLTILASDGKAVANQETGALENKDQEGSPGHDPSAVLDFLAKYQATH